MHPDTDKIAGRLRDFGFMLLGLSLKECAYGASLDIAPPYEIEDFKGPINLFQAAHGAEPRLGGNDALAGHQEEFRRFGGNR